MLTIGIVGLGQIGGSIAKALVNRGFKIIGFDLDSKTLESASSIGINRACGLEQIVAEANLVFVCVTLNSNRETLERILHYSQEMNVAPTITDVASYKSGAVPKDMNRSNLILGHPMAGTHGQGFDSSNAELFNEARWVIIFRDGIDQERLISLMEVVSLLGARIHFCDMSWHDQAMSLISALPHAQALALGAVAGKAADAEAKLALAAGSYNGAIRVLLSEKSFFRDLIWYNRHTLIPLIHSISDIFRDLASLLKLNDLSGLEELIAKAKEGGIVKGRKKEVCTVLISLKEVEVYFKNVVNTECSVSFIDRNDHNIRLLVERLV